MQIRFKLGEVLDLFGWLASWKQVMLPLCFTGWPDEDLGDYSGPPQLQPEPWVEQMAACMLGSNPLTTVTLHVHQYTKLWKKHHDIVCTTH